MSNHSKLDETSSPTAGGRERLLSRKSDSFVVNSQTFDNNLSKSCGNAHSVDLLSRRTCTEFYSGSFNPHSRFDEHEVDGSTTSVSRVGISNEIGRNMRSASAIDLDFELKQRPFSAGTIHHSSTVDSSTLKNEDDLSKVPKWKGAAAGILSRTKSHSYSIEFKKIFGSIINELRSEILMVDQQPKHTKSLQHSNASSASHQPRINSIHAKTDTENGHGVLLENISDRKHGMNLDLDAFQDLSPRVEREWETSFLKASLSVISNNANNSSISKKLIENNNSNIHNTEFSDDIQDDKSQIGMSNASFDSNKNHADSDKRMTQIDFGRFQSQLISSWLLESYACAFAEGLILLQGRLYVTESHLFFHSIFSSNQKQIFGVKGTKLYFAIKDIAKIKKSSFIFPTAITIVLQDGRSFQFASLISREDTFHTLMDLSDRCEPCRIALSLAKESFPFLKHHEEQIEKNGAPVSESSVHIPSSHSDIESASSSVTLPLCSLQPDALLSTPPSYSPLLQELLVSHFKFGPLPQDKLKFGIERSVKALASGSLAQSWQGVVFDHIPLSKVMQIMYLKRHGPNTGRCFLNEWLDVAKNIDFPLYPPTFYPLPPQNFNEIKSFPFVCSRVYTYKNYVTSTTLTRMIGLPQYALSEQTDALIILNKNNVVIESRVQADGIPMSDRFHIIIRYHLQSIRNNTATCITSEFDVESNKGYFILLSKCRSIALSEWAQARLVFLRLMANFICEDMSRKSITPYVDENRATMTFKNADEMKEGLNSLLDDLPTSDQEPNSQDDFTNTTEHDSTSLISSSSLNVKHNDQREATVESSLSARRIDAVRRRSIASSDLKNSTAVSTNSLAKRSANFYLLLLAFFSLLFMCFSRFNGILYSNVASVQFEDNWKKTHFDSSGCRDKEGAIEEVVNCLENRIKKLENILEILLSEKK